MSAGIVRECRAATTRPGLSNQRPRDLKIAEPLFSGSSAGPPRRQVLLVAPAVEALKLHRDRQDEERQRAQSAWHDEGLVFPNTIGRPTNPSNFLRRDFYRLLERAGLPVSGSTTYATARQRCCSAWVCTQRS